MFGNKDTLFHNMEILEGAASISSSVMHELENKWENLTSDSTIDYYQENILQFINPTETYFATCHLL